MGKADDELIAIRRAEGKSHSAIAKEVGLCAGTVAKRLQRKEIADLVENLRHGLVTATLPTAVSNVSHAIGEYQAPAEVDGRGAILEDTKQLREHGFKASLEIMRGAGLLPSNGGNVFVQQNVFEGGMPEGIRKVLEAIAAKEVGGRSLMDEDSIEGEIVNEEERDSETEEGS